jgi:hypothetical protein
MPALSCQSHPPRRQPIRCQPHGQQLLDDLRPTTSHQALLTATAPDPTRSVSSCSRVHPPNVACRDPANEPPFRGVSSSMTFPDAGSYHRRACLTRLPCAFRLSQPLDALFRQHPLGLLSCRIRLRGSAFRGFSLPVAPTAFTAPCPACLNSTHVLPDCRIHAPGSSVCVRPE